MTTTWVLDCDNTLYPAGSGFFRHVTDRIDLYMLERLAMEPAEVQRLRRSYRERYGITLGGLLAEHGVDPADYLEYVHDVPVEELIEPDPKLAECLGRLEGRKVVFTNGSTRHAMRVAAHVGVAGLIDAYYDIAFMDYLPKPREHGYRKLLEALGVEGPDCVMADDMVVNLATAKKLGMRTVLIGGEGAEGDVAGSMAGGHCRVERLSELTRLYRKGIGCDVPAAPEADQTEGEENFEGCPVPVSFPA